MRKTLGAVCGLLLLASCGGGGASHRPHSVEVRLSSSLSGAYQGWTSWGSDGSATEVLILEGIGESRSVAVLCHELWHVAGFHHHLLDPSCVASEFGADNLSPIGDVQPTVRWAGEPCAEEARALLDAGGPFVLRPEEALREATEDAATWWNLHLGTELFIVE